MRICTACRRLLAADARACPTDGAAAESVETLPAGARLDAYRIDRVLGEGGMGFVYEATHEELGRRTAIKMLRRELAAMPQIVTRFLNEARAVNLINHQNVIDVYDYGDRYGTVYFIMEFLEGETLDDLMRKRQPMQLPLLLHVFGQVARALAAAHAKQIVHRDLKPANVFVVAREDNPYFIKLLDFGIAQLRGEDAVQGLTLAGSVMGTPQYMSPEQISGGTVDARTDVWAFGVMLYRAATGHAPFRGEEFGELADHILHHPPPPAGELVPPGAIPAVLSQLIMSCLEPRAENRCPSIAAVLDGLERVKHACTLDDDAILAAVKADAGALGERMPPQLDDPTRNSLAGSLPKHQGAGDPHAGRPAPRPRPRSRIGRYAIVGAVVVGLGGAGYGAFGGGIPSKVRSSTDGSDPTAPRPPDEASSGPRRLPPAPAPPVPPVPPESVDSFGPRIAKALAAGDVAQARALADRGLRLAITSGTLDERGAAVDALARVRGKASAPLLYVALEGPADVRSKAVPPLVELALPDTVQKLHDALADAGTRVKVELSTALYQLGDKTVRPILKRALEDPGMRRIAAVAMAAVGDDAGRAVLVDALEAARPGGDVWRSAAAALARLGDGKARAALEAELAQPDARRLVGAAELLARAGDAKAREQLARVAVDPDFARRGEAALALAQLGDRRGLPWISDGFRSLDVEERLQALAICGRLGAGTPAHLPAIATLATDRDLRVRMTVEAVVLGL